MLVREIPLGFDLLLEQSIGFLLRFLFSCDFDEKCVTVSLPWLFHSGAGTMVKLGGAVVAVDGAMVASGG
ncbi:hypothetical protein Droror1_Dr00018993 [Drosera rotundifolia]